MKRLFVIPILIFCMVLAGCQPIEQSARDTSAALGGAITAAQQQNQAACQANPSGAVCQLIDRAINAQNALITATEAYCGLAPQLNAPGAPCTPVKGLDAALQSAISNATPFITQLKGAIQ